MAKILKGAEVAAALNEQMKAAAAHLKKRNIHPTLCIIRVGERPDDLSYERAAVKRAEKAGVRVVCRVLEADCSRQLFDRTLEEANRDPDIHGILLFRPLPKHLDDERTRQMIAPQKDVDGCTDLSLAGVFSGAQIGFAPCTAQAAMEILKYYQIPISGKKACVIGRSLVIGRPVAMMLMAEDATVVNCHTKTKEPEQIAKKADILIAASGQLRSVDERYVNPGQVIIDVGINWDEEKEGIAGDVDFEAVAPRVSALTPVPGGVGSVTTAVLISHVIEAAKRAGAQTVSAAAGTDQS